MSDVNMQSLPLTLHKNIPADWADYNGHMNEARYLEAFSAAMDQFMEMIGCDAEYIASGGSYFTAETHICHLDEVQVGDDIEVRSQCLLGQGKKLHLFQWMHHGGRLLATGEHMLIHVSLQTRRATEPANHIAKRLGDIAKEHAQLPWPKQAGRGIGQSR